MWIFFAYKKMDIFCKLYKMYPKPLLNYRRDQHLRTPEYFILCTAFFLYDLITKCKFLPYFQTEIEDISVIFIRKKFPLKIRNMHRLQGKKNVI